MASAIETLPMTHVGKPVRRFVTEVSVPVLAPVSLILVAIIWGSSYLVVKDILASVPPFAFLALRYLIAIPVVVFIFREDVFVWFSRKATTTEIIRNIHPGLSLGIAFALQTYGLKHTSPGKAALLTALIFLFVPAIEYFGGARIRVLSLVPMLVLASFGVFLLAQPWLYGWSAPDMLILLCAVAFSIQIVLTGRVRRTTHFATVFIVQGLSVLVISVLGWILTESNFELVLSVSDWFRIIYVGLVVTAGCYLIQFAAQGYVAPRYVGVIFALEPVAALLLSTGFGYEVLSITSIIGSAAILASVFLAAIGSTQNSNSLT